jgi:hypothetical protein
MGFMECHCGWHEFCKNARHEFPTILAMSTVTDAPHHAGRVSRDTISFWKNSVTPSSKSSSKYAELAREIVEECVLPELLMMADELSSAGVPVKVTVSDFEDPLVMRHASAAAWATLEICSGEAETPVMLGFAGKASDHGWRIEVFSRKVKNAATRIPRFTKELSGVSSFMRSHFADLLPCKFARPLSNVG